MRTQLRGMLRRLRAHGRLERLAIGALWGAEEPPNPRHLIVLDYPLALRERYERTKPHPLLFALIDANRAAYESRLQRIVAGLTDFKAIPVTASAVAAEAGEPNWLNGFLPALDAMALYTFLVDGDPKRYLEVGSGNSTVLRAAPSATIACARASPRSIRIRASRWSGCATSRSDRASRTSTSPRCSRSKRATSCSSTTRTGSSPTRMRRRSFSTSFPTFSRVC